LDFDPIPEELVVEAGFGVEELLDLSFVIGINGEVPDVPP
jgi:hypothetical protein